MDFAEPRANLTAALESSIANLDRFTAATHPEVQALARQTQAALRQIAQTLVVALLHGPDAFATPVAAAAPEPASEPAADPVPPTEPPPAP